LDNLRQLLPRGSCPPGAKGLVFLPYFAGDRTPIHDPHAKGMLFGLNLTHTRADIYRALLEGIACGTNHVMEIYLEAGQDPRAILAVGGGTKNRVWAQATSDVSGRTQIVREKTVGASYGDAFLAALAVGDVKPETIRAWNPVATEFTPKQTVRNVESALIAGEVLAVEFGPAEAAVRTRFDSDAGGRGEDARRRCANRPRPTKPDFRHPAQAGHWSWTSS
jgi:sugar (pentulose or hexulose) kinase